MQKYSYSMLQCSKGPAEKGVTWNFSERLVFGIAVIIICTGIAQNDFIFFLVVFFFCQKDSRLVIVPSLETNIIPALWGEINLCVITHKNTQTHTHTPIFFKLKLYIVAL